MKAFDSKAKSLSRFSAFALLLVVACAPFMGCSAPQTNTGQPESSSAAAETTNDFTAIEFITSYKNDLSDDDIDDLLKIAQSTQSDIWEKENGYGDKTDEVIDSSLKSLETAISAVAKKYDVVVTGKISEGDVESIVSMLQTAFQNTEKYKQALSATQEYVNSQEYKDLMESLRSGTE